jgi:hypothetical protein
MVALDDIPDVHRLFLELQANEQALAIFQNQGIVTGMALRETQDAQVVAQMSLDTSEMPGQEAIATLMIDIINWRQYLIKEALQGLGVDVDPATPAEAAAFNAHQQTQRQRKR